MASAKQISDQPRKRSPFELIMSSRLGKLLSRVGLASRSAGGSGLLDLSSALLSLRGRASGPALASAFFDLYEASTPAARRAFLTKVSDAHPRNAAAIDDAIAKWQEKRDDITAQALHIAAESPNRTLIGKLNLAPQGIRRLISMREDLLGISDKTPGTKALDKELKDAFSDWFNAGFLELRRIGWDSPATLLERIIKYEAVHSISGWGDLRRRVEPADRRCYGFFHAQMEDDPLIFVEVALTHQVPGSISSVIAKEREVIDPHSATCAIFYSISSCQKGLRGIPFGNYLIKRVAGVLKDELPQLKQFATLSPVPGFAKWLATESGEGAPVPKGEKLRHQAARYLTTARTHGGMPLDSVARFHLGNGARLDAIHLNGDLSENGLNQSHGIMVNYVYDLDEIEANHFALYELGTIAMSKAVQQLAEGTQKPASAAKRKRVAA